jgi:hypothetical protein
MYDKMSLYSVLATRVLAGLATGKGIFISRYRSRQLVRSTKMLKGR